MSGSMERIIAYHQETKHQPNRMARGPGRMDWANQPDPFRSYEGSRGIALERVGFEGTMKGLRPYPLNLENLSRFFFESLALSGRKAAAGSEWSLRVNPSSGNLHPTECYLLAGGGGLDLPTGVYHYQPKDHSLELLAGIKEESWQSIQLPSGTVLLILTSIYWRESWKYGARAFRYCMLDLGHALAAAGEAARCLGWEISLLDDMGTEGLSRILWKGREGTISDHRSGAERPDLMLALFSDGKVHRVTESLAPIAELETEPLLISPNILSPGIVPWQEIDMVSEAAIKPPTRDVYSSDACGECMLQEMSEEEPVSSREEDIDLSRKYCQLLRRRRSAQAMDGRSSMPLESFHAILKAVMPRQAKPVLPWRPQVNPVLFVHRVEDIKPGLYILLRDRKAREDLRGAMDPDFLWERPSRTPAGLELYQLASGDARVAARESSCRQDIASDGCFAAAMISRFEGPLQEYGPWFYSRLHWECGLIGQALYLSSEAEGFRGCGIGCFFDDVVHRMLGLSDLGYQDLYHFTVGRALIDSRLVDLPAYG